MRLLTSFALIALLPTAAAPADPPAAAVSAGVIPGEPSSPRANDVRPRSRPATPAPEQPSTAIFVACPVYRDTDAGPKSGCWLATDPATGVRYDVSRGRTKPMIGRQVLIEGVGAGQASPACGGSLLEPVHVSVLETPCARHMLPAEDYPGNRFALPADVMQPLGVPRRVPEPPFDTRRFSIWFDFGADFLRYQYSEVILERAALYAAASGGRVMVHGFADTAGFTAGGRHLAEPAALARQRAEAVSEALRRLRVPAKQISTRWHEHVEPEPAAEPAQPSLRRVEIVIAP